MRQKKPSQRVHSKETRQDKTRKEGWVRDATADHVNDDDNDEDEERDLPWY